MQVCTIQSITKYNKQTTQLTRTNLHTSNKELARILPSNKILRHEHKIRNTPTDAYFGVDTRPRIWSFSFNPYLHLFPYETSNLILSFNSSQMLYSISLCPYVVYTRTKTQSAAVST